MDRDGKNSILSMIKHVISNKQTKITLYIAAVLWLAVGTQVIVNITFKKNFQITEAFVKTDMQEMESNLEVIAEYKGKFLSNEGKESLIRNLAEAIGLNIDKNITINKEDTRNEYSFTKHAKQATTEIKVVSMEREEDSALQVKQYIIVRLRILESIQNIEKYKNIIDKALKEIGVKNRQITMQFSGNYKGNRTIEEKRRISEFLVGQLQGKTSVEYEEGNLYTVYAYTGLINEYIVSMGSKVNIQIAITYNEIADKTTVILATPILNQNW